jgi:diguanylate cyclase (GGDEF)-like protein
MSSVVSAVRSWVRSEDHYYWLTSFLAARGLQQSTCRLIAASMIGLSVMPLILTFSSLGPSGTTNRVLAAAVSICSMAMATVWLRHGWPTRFQSQICVMVGSICIAVACLIEVHPVIGLMGATTFIVLSAFTAFFHDRRVLAFVWIVGAATLVVLGTRTGGFDPLVTICGIALFVLTNVFVVFVCRNVISLVNRDFHNGELEPLTGLLTRDAFTDRVATLVSARDRNDDRFVAIIVVSMDSFSLLTAMSGVAGGQRARIAIGHRIAVTLRRDAILAHVGESEFLVADTFNGSDATVLTDRLHQTVRSAPFRLTASIGAVTTPLGPLVGLPPHDVVEELVTLATSNMYSARRTGGQRTEATECPRLTTIDGADTDECDDDKSA